MAKEIVPITIATTDPVVTSDLAHGFRKGQLWVNTTTPALFYCSNNATGAAVWNSTSGSSVTDEHIMDVVGAMLGDTATIDVTYNDAGDIESFAIVAGSITDTHVAAANKDGASGTASMRTLGTGASQAAAGNHTHAAAAPAAHESTHEANGSDALPWTTIHGKGTTGARPAAATTNAGYLYYNISTSTLQRSTGSAWEDIGESGGGGGSAAPEDTSLNLGLQFMGV